MKRKIDESDDPSSTRNKDVASDFSKSVSCFITGTWPPEGLKVIDSVRNEAMKYVVEEVWEIFSSELKDLKFSKDSGSTILQIINQKVAQENLETQYENAFEYYVGISDEIFTALVSQIPALLVGEADDQQWLDFIKPNQ